MQLALGHLLTQGGNWLRRQHAAGRGEVDTASSEGAKRIKVDTDFTWGWRERERKGSFYNSLQFLVAIRLKSDFFTLFCLFSLCPSYTWMRLTIVYKISKYELIRRIEKGASMISNINDVRDDSSIQCVSGHCSHRSIITRNLHSHMDWISANAPLTFTTFTTNFTFTTTSSTTTTQIGNQTK